MKQRTVTMQITLDLRAVALLSVLLLLLGFMILPAAAGAFPRGDDPEPQAYDAQNADKVDGLHASRWPKANTLLALRKNKKFPATVIPAYTKAQSDRRYVRKSSPSWKARTGYISLSAAAFRPAWGGSEFANYGFYLCTNNVSDSSYYANAQLPDGATITGLWYYFHDSSGTKTTSAAFYRGTHGGGLDTMAACSSSGLSGTTSCSDTSIAYPTVSNANYDYFVWVGLNDTCATMMAYNVLIRYEYTEPY